MPIPTGGLIRVKLVQEHNAEEILNTFWYHTQDDTNPASLAGFTAAFDAKWMAPLSGVMAIALKFISIEAENVLTLDAPTIITPSQPTGSVIGEELPMFNAAAWRLNRTNKETRNGQKRLGGQAEANSSANQWTAAWLLSLASVTVLFDDVLNDGVKNFDPVIVRRLDPPTHPNWIFNIVSSATLNSFVSSQVSRKRNP